MNYTTNYHLPQWVESDRILMEDFNQAMETLDGGIAAAKATADTAKNTADSAESKADAAQATANNAYCPQNQPFVVGTYVGTGTDTTVTLGFRPKVVAVDDMGSFSSGYELGLDGIDRSAVRVVDGGFRVAAGSLNMNESGETYRYYALG